MNVRGILIVMFCLSAFVSTTTISSDAATIFGGSRIVAIDHDQRTVTFTTKEGQTWTLPVNDPEILSPQRIAKDDQVTIEIDLNDRISKVVKLSDVPAAPRADMPAQTDDR
jgi:hypothetical protein